MRAILRAGAYELIARPDVPVASVISEYVDVAHAFYDKRESGFVNGLLDAIAKDARPARGRLAMDEAERHRAAAADRHRTRRRAGLPTMRRCSTGWCSPTTASPRACIILPGDPADERRVEAGCGQSVRSRRQGRDAGRGACCR